ncbi:MAG: lysophospholipid acyltransferase family protein [Deltaproteobacteria bacterium]|nr:lysophospholipid acyltransferase family protein [Deltaproteobacteria bacterium]
MLASLLAFFAALLIRLLKLTWRVHVVGPRPEPIGGPHVYCFWHGRQAGLFAYPRSRPTAVLSSLSRDGELQARILARLGLTVLRGSSSRGGATGLRALVGAVRDGADAAFAVDGPRGPLHQVKPGAILAAQQSGAALVPITARASRAWVFNKAWDRYLLPKPFARVEIIRAASITVDGVAVDSAREELERTLTSLQAA